MPFPPLPDRLALALAERGYAEPTPVQAAVLEDAHAGRDLLVSAQTGSGKTVAFGLAVARTLLAEDAPNRKGKEPLALVVAPTRELAFQVERELTWLYAHARLSVVACVGGTDMRREERLLFRGPHVVVGTPGRLADHLRRGGLDLTGARAVVLDEADEMLDLGFREELEALLDATPSDRMTLLFSATIPAEIASLAKRYQRDAIRLAASSEKEPHGDIEYHAIVLAAHDREHGVVNVLRYFDARGALVFCATREGVKHLHANLVERGFHAVALSGELSQPERTRALQALRDGRASVCVATDVAARGLDLPDLGLVIHADLPLNRQALLHRSGRTGRAGRKGTCVVLVPHFRRRAAQRLLDSAHLQGSWSPAPSAADIRERDHARLLEEIAEAAAEPAPEDLAAVPELLARRTAEQLIATLVRLKRAELPAPEEISDVPRETAPRKPPFRKGPWKPHGKKPHRGKAPRRK